MASVIIDGKDRNGTRVSASLDEFLWDLVLADSKSPADARAWVRTKMLERISVRGPWTKYIRDMCLMRVCKPSLVKRALGPEGQIDIEEY